MNHECKKCGNPIHKNEYKIKDTHDNHHRYYYHLECFDPTKAREQVNLWTLTLQKSDQNERD